MKTSVRATDASPNRHRSGIARAVLADRSTDMGVDSMSSEVGSAWDQLELVVGEEIARIGRTKEVALRDELEFSIWPFLHDVVQAVRQEFESLDDEDAAEPAVPADLGA